MPVEEHIAQVKVAMRPVCTIEVVIGVYAHQVVEVDLVGSLVLILGEVELVCHLVGEKQSLLACLLIAHSVG